MVIGLVYLELYMPAGTAAPATGEELFVDGLGLGIGGALNAASVAHALGTRVELLHPRPRGPYASVGTEASRELGLRCRPWPSGSRPAVSVVFATSGDRAFLSSADFGAFDRCPPLPTLPHPSWILVAGLREARAIEDRLRAARASGTRVCINASWAPDELAAISTRRERPWDLLVLNEKEASRAAPDARDPVAALAASVPEVVLTRAGRGVAALLGGERVEIAAAPTPEVVDATGSGDAFCAGLLHARLRGAGPAEALGYASRVAARILGIRGGVASDASLFRGLESWC